MNKETIEDVVVCFDNLNVKNEMNSTKKQLNVPYKALSNKLVVDYGHVEVVIHFISVDGGLRFDCFNFSHVRISEMSSTNCDPRSLCRTLEIIQSGRIILEDRKLLKKYSA